MHKIIRKIMISTIMALLLIVTFGTITFAWIGITSYSRFEQFTISLDVSDLNNNADELEKQAYGLEISVTGEAGTFSTSANSTELKRSILVNYDSTYSTYLDKNIDNSYIESDETVNNTFSNIILDQATLKCNYNANESKYDEKVTSNSTIEDLFVKNNALRFENILSREENKDTTKVFKFDLYISVYKASENDYGADGKLDCYLNGNILRGSKRTVNTVFDYTYPITYAKNYSVLGINAGDSVLDKGHMANNVLPGTTISGVKTVDSSSSARIAFLKHNVVAKGHPELYGNETSEENKATDIIIYQGGSKYPEYVTEGNYETYSFGGIMEDELNFALQNYNLKHTDRQIGSVPKHALVRQYLEEVYDKNERNQLIDKSNPTEAIDTLTMMKITVYFWFEGWDADCFDVIDRSPVALNIGFTAYKETQQP